MRIFILCLSLVSMMLCTSLHAQKARFKNNICAVQKTKLPSNYSEPDKRSYQVIKKGAYSTNIDPNERPLYGWTLDEENPDIKAAISIFGFRSSRPKKGSEKKEKKDKDGNVTSSWTEYYYTVSSTGMATLRVYGKPDQLVFEEKKETKSKYEQKQEEKKAAEKADLVDNPFLSEEVIEEAEESDIQEDLGIEEAPEMPLLSTHDIGESKDFKTNNYRRSSDALKEYYDKIKPKMSSFRSSFPDKSYRNGMSKLNALYGFAPYKYKFYLKKMKTEKHPEYKMWNDAIQATQTIFKTFKYNKSIDDKQESFRPIIDYFAGIVDSIDDDDKKQRKLKKSAYTNLVYILYYLDLHGEAIEWADKYVKSKKLDGIAKRIGRMASAKDQKLAFHKLRTAHVESTLEVDDKDIEAGEVQGDSADEG